MAPFTFSNLPLSTSAPDLLQVILPSLSLGCFILLSHNPALFLYHLSFPELLNSFMSHFLSLDYHDVLFKATVRATVDHDHFSFCRNLCEASAPADSVCNSGFECDAYSRIVLVLGTLLVSVLLAGATSHYLGD